MTSDLNLLPFAALLTTLLAFVGLITLRRRGVGFTPLVLIGLGVGVGIGIGFRGNLDYVSFLGDLYIQVIIAIVAPLIFISILSSVTSLGSTAKLRTIGLSSAFWLLLTNAIAIVLTLAVALSLELGKGVSLAADASTNGDSLLGLVKPLDQVLLDLVPSNLAGDFVSNNIVAIILFALLFSVAYLVAARRDDPQLRTFKNVVDATKKIVMVAVGFIIELTPYAVLALVSATVATAITRIEDVLSLLLVLVLALGLAFVSAYVVNGVLLRVFADVSPLRWFRLLTPAQYTAFSTQSSVGTLPLTIRTLTQKVGVPEEIATFTAPIGTTIGMPGCSGIWPVIVAVFTINALGIDYSLWDYAALAGLCLLVSLGTAGVPGTAIITATAVLTAVGLPIYLLIVLIPISAVAGTASTMANVSAAATAATIVARRQGTLDDAVFRGVAAPVAGPTPAQAQAAPVLPAETLPVTERLSVAGETATMQFPVAGAPLATLDEFFVPDGIEVGQCELPTTRRTNRSDSVRTS